MNIKELIALSDIYIAKAYADYVITDWGIMYYDDSNPTRHDTNHAYILNDDFFEQAADGIIEFYKLKNREPRIYLLKNQKEKFENFLTDKGFDIFTVGEFHYFFLTDENKIPKTNRLDIKELTLPSSVTEKLLYNLYDTYMEEDPDTINRTRIILQNAVVNPNCQVFCGYYKGEPACLAMIVESSDFGMYCFDLVETGKKFQNHGFARELISFMVNLCNRPTYLYSENPTAIRIYEQAGFTPIEIADNPVYWRAVYKGKV